MAAITIAKARAAKAKAVKALADIDAVIGIGITRVDESYAVKVNLRGQPPAGLKIPATIDGVPLRVERVGTIRALGKSA